MFLSGSQRKKISRLSPKEILLGLSMLSTQNANGSYRLWFILFIWSTFLQYLVFTKTSLNEVYFGHSQQHTVVQCIVSFFLLECPLKCQNGGTLNLQNCVCSCPSGWRGMDCSGKLFEVITQNKTRQCQKKKRENDLKNNLNIQVSQDFESFYLECAFSSGKDYWVNQRKRRKKMR